MASSAAGAPSTGVRPLQIAAGGRVGGALAALERWLENEREQLALWLPVMLGMGIAAWFLLPDWPQWAGFLLASGAVALLGAALDNGGRAARLLTIAAAAMALGCGLIWWRAERVAAPVLARPAIVEVTGRVERVEELPSRGLVRLRIATAPGAGLPPVVRVNLTDQDVPAGLGRGATVTLGARLMPPAPPAVPGAYDYARVAWFDGLGATGRGFAPVRVRQAGAAGDTGPRARLSRHIRERIGGGAGAIAASFATGDQGAIPEEDAEAMRRSGLAHLLSISGLHVTAVTAGTMWLVLRLLALFPALALRVRLPLVAAGAGAAAAIGYTWLTGGEVPTIRSCVAALLVLLAISLGREAITLRLVAAGACVVLLLWPEALAGPSFQLSFAAVTAIVALHEHPRIRAWFGPHEEGWTRRGLRQLVSLLLTGLVVELALMPIALFHFHKAGLYGALANIVAIPLTTFVVMPLEALALALDAVGAGAPVWWLTGRTLDLLLWIAHATADAPGAVQALPAMPVGAFALLAGGLLWLALWRTSVRYAGFAAIALGTLWALSTPAPDLLVTGDGRHLALRMTDGRMALLRDRAGDYVRDMLAENGGAEEELAPLFGQPGAACSADLCMADVRHGGRSWRVAATRSVYRIPWDRMMAVCRSADIFVSDRRLPPGCNPRWLKLDRDMLARTGGVAVTFSTGTARMVRQPLDRHPWVQPALIAPPRRQ